MPTLFDWNPVDHPRDYKGRFRDKHVSLKRELLGPALNTQQRYTRMGRHGWRYRHSRKELHDSIIRHFMLQGRKPVGGTRPKALLLACGPGSGKSTLVDRGLVAPPDGAVRVDADAIKEMLPEYQRFKEAGLKDAAKLVHDETRDIAGRLENVAIRQGYPIVVDGTGASNTFVSLIRHLKRSGYDVEVVIVNSSVDTALRRVHERYKKTGRFVPDHLVRQLHRSVSRRLPQILAEDLESLTIYDNDRELTKVATKTKNTYTVHDEEAYDRLFMKADAQLAQTWTS